MPRTTSYTLSDELDTFIQTQITEGKYATASEVVRAALESFKEETRKEAWLLASLDVALKSKVRHSSEETWRSVDAAVKQAAR